MKNFADYFEKISLNREYKRTLKKFNKAINNVTLNSRFEYLSKTKLEYFLDYLDLNLDTNIQKNTSIKNKTNLSADLKKLINLSKSNDKETEVTSEINPSIHRHLKNNLEYIKNSLPKVDDIQEGGYLLLHFPVFGGKLDPRTEDTYPDTYWWYGTYGNIKLYLCGKSSNICDLNVSSADSSWDPSNLMNSKILFDDIYNEIMNDNALNSSYYNLFDKLTVINEGTYRSAEKQFGWKDILIRCDYIEKVNSQIKIFGSPIFVTTNTPVDYGWYKPIRYSNRYFYEYDGSNFTGKMIISKSIHENFKKNLDSKIKIDFKSGISFIDKDNILLLKQNITTTVESTESVKYPDLNNLYDYSEILAINIPYEVIRN